jgi:uncharacterized protein YndB with AHSA1/START domain
MTRRIENRIEVAGTPEEVWELIATGPGIEAWFVPAEVEPGVGGRVAIDVGTGMADCGTVTAWEPPHRFAYSEDWEDGTGLASEFLVEARSGGTCVVRIVSTLHARSGDWDELLEDLRRGWDGYLLILRLYREHFPGRPVRTIFAGADSHATAPAALTELVRGLGIERATVRERVHSAHGPRLAGVVEHRAAQEMIMRIDEPAPGIALLFAYPMGGQVRSFVHLYLYGATEEGEAERWREWVAAVPSAG